MVATDSLKLKLVRLLPQLDERSRRMVAASEALHLGRGGISQVSRACGLSRVTISKGIRELDGPPLPSGRIRRAGAGRPGLLKLDPGLPQALDALVEPLARGDPEAPLRWTCKSTRTLAAAAMRVMLRWRRMARPASDTSATSLLTRAYSSTHARTSGRSSLGTWTVRVFPRTFRVKT